MSTIAVIGTGLLGAGFALKALESGHSVRVWNRTASKAQPIVDAGAYHASDPADAVRGVERVHLILSADQAVDSVIAAMRPSLAADTWIVDHSTNLPQLVAERCATLREQGVRYIHAPVFMGPSNSRKANGQMLISGPQADVDALRPALEQMTGTLSYVGERDQDAAVRKILGNGLIIGLASLGGDLLQLGQESGFSVQDTLAALESFSPFTARMSKRVAQHSPDYVSFELSMARKDIGLMIQTAGADKMCVLPGLADKMDACIEAGQGSQNFTAVAALK